MQHKSVPNTCTIAENLALTFWKSWVHRGAKPTVCWALLNCPCIVLEFRRITMQKHLNLGSDVRRLLLAILIGNLLSAVFAAAQQPDPVIALESQLRSTGLAPLPDFDSRRASRAEISTARRQLAREFERRLGGGMD